MITTRLPVRIFSDLHLGHRASQIQNISDLREIIQGAGTAIFNGDTWEELAKPWRARSAEMLAELKALCAELDCDPIFIRGNHDPSFEGPAYLELAGGKIAITHGDALLYDSSPWKREAITSPAEIQQIWEKYPDAATNLEDRLAVAQEIALRLPSKTHPRGRRIISRIIDAAHPPQRALHMLKAWVGFQKNCGTFCGTYLPRAEVLITGHFHYAQIRKARGRHFINTGSFVTPARPLCAQWNGEKLELRPIVRVNNQYKFATKSNHSIKL